MRTCPNCNGIGIVSKKFLFFSYKGSCPKCAGKGLAPELPLPRPGWRQIRYRPIASPAPSRSARADDDDSFFPLGSSRTIVGESSHVAVSGSRDDDERLPAGGGSFGGAGASGDYSEPVHHPEPSHSHHESSHSDHSSHSDSGSSDSGSSDSGGGGGD